MGSKGKRKKLLEEKVKTCASFNEKPHYCPNFNKMDKINRQAACILTMDIYQAQENYYLAGFNIYTSTIWLFKIRSKIWFILQIMNSINEEIHIFNCKVMNCFLCCSCLETQNPLWKLVHVSMYKYFCNLVGGTDEMLNPNQITKYV